MLGRRRAGNFGNEVYRDIAAERACVFLGELRGGWDFEAEASLKMGGRSKAFC